ncbi:Insulinase (Peptidase M16) [Gryganskiella cystojenkinii]|nr:Insulinase (Peptidase M16) [Gryganskiella cystojenkinii]
MLTLSLEVLGHQLSYLVWATLREDNGGTWGLTVTIQSERDPNYLESHIDSLFKDRIATMIESTMTEEEFKRQVESIVVKTSEKSKNLTEETFKYWNLSLGF